MNPKVLCPHCKKELTGLPYLEAQGIAMFFCPNCSSFLSAAFTKPPSTPVSGKA